MCVIKMVFSGIIIKLDKNEENPGGNDDIKLVNNGIESYFSR